jgi:hypothetical protein
VGSPDGDGRSFIVVSVTLLNRLPDSCAASPFQQPFGQSAPLVVRQSTAFTVFPLACTDDLRETRTPWANWPRHQPSSAVTPFSCRRETVRTADDVKRRLTELIW